MSTYLYNLKLQFFLTGILTWMGTGKHPSFLIRFVRVLQDVALGSLQT